MSEDGAKSAQEMVAETDSGGRVLTGSMGKTLFYLCILWSLFQLYIASKVPGVLAQATGVSDFANIVAQARYVHLAFAMALATLAFPLSVINAIFRFTTGLCLSWGSQPAYIWSFFGLRLPTARVFGPPLTL